jgi:hypothetical protein
VLKLFAERFDELPHSPELPNGGRQERLDVLEFSATLAPQSRGKPLERIPLSASTPFSHLPRMTLAAFPSPSSPATAHQAEFGLGFPAPAEPT